ncbi:MAG TPA: CBS domain-containing protein [Methanomassiliicoccales archaeon]|jgi:CBS domain-containing protein|nr:CBS domain-containing protein [Methanomassiliicoccales archaeon]
MAAEPIGCLVKDIMTKKVITVGPEATLREVAHRLFENHISGLPVVDEQGRLLGIISETDIVAAVKTYERRLNMVFPTPSILSISFKPDYKEKELAEAVSEFQAMKAKDIMTREIYVLGPEDTLQRAVLIMNSFGVNRIPIVENMRLVGIIARADIIRYLGTVDPGCLLPQKKGKT